MTSSTSLAHHILSDSNRQRLGNILDEAWRRGTASRKVLMELEEKLELADCVPPQDVPYDVVTVNSKFRVCDLDTGEVHFLVLRFPDSAEAPHRDLSVLDPIGCAILGCRVGDEVVAKSANGLRRLRLAEVVYLRVDGCPAAAYAIVGPDELLRRNCCQNRLIVG